MAPPPGGAPSLAARRITPALFSAHTRTLTERAYAGSQARVPALEGRADAALEHPAVRRRISIQTGEAHLVVAALTPGHRAAGVVDEHAGHLDRVAVLHLHRRLHQVVL